MWALYFKGTGIFFVLRRLYTSCVVDDFRSILGYRCGPYISKALGFSLFDGRCLRRVLKTISVRYLDIDVGLLFVKGTGIFLLTAEDDFSLILGYRLLDLIFERY